MRTNILSKFILITFLSIVLTSCGGGGGGSSEENPQCPESDPYCTSKYSELRIKTPNDQIWLSLYGEYKTLQASTQGILKGETNFIDYTSKDLEYWTSTNTAVFTVDQDGLITAVGIGEAELIYELQIPGDIRQPARKRIVVKETDDNIMPTVAIKNKEISVTGGETVSLNGSDSFDTDGEITQYEWLLQKGPLAITITDKDQSSSSFVAPESKYTYEYVLRLTVTDNDGGTGTDTVIVTVNPSIANIAPKAQADDVEYHQLTKVILDGSKSSDEDDGTENLSYFWEQTDSENIVVINNANSTVADFIAPETDQKLTLNFKLTVTDPEGAESSVDIKATILPPEVNLSPTARPEFISINSSEISEIEKSGVSNDGRTTSILINEQTSVCIEGNKSSDPEDTTNISYLWDDPAQELDGINQTNRSENQICFNTPKLTEEKDIEITLTVTDTETATGKSSIFLKVLPVNATPEVKAEHTIANRTVILADISEDDGSIESCEWRQNESDTIKVTITNSDKCEASFPEPVTKDGTTLSFYLTVTDDEGMTVTNEEPYIVSIKPVDLTPQNLKIEHTYEGESVSSNLIWDDVTHNLNLNQTNYTIYRSKLPGVKPLPGNIFDSTYGESKGLENQTADAYYYVVTATYPDGTESELSNEAVYLPATERLYLTEDIKEITINWDIVAGADSYLVSWNEDGGLPQKEVVATNSYTDSDTTTGSKYNYRVTPIKNISGVQNRGVRSFEKSYYARAGEWESLSGYTTPFFEVDSSIIKENNETIIYFADTMTGGLNSLNISTGKWGIESAAKENGFDRFFPTAQRNGMRTLSYNGKIYIFGGDTLDEATIIMIFDPNGAPGEEWTEVVTELTPVDPSQQKVNVTLHNNIAYQIAVSVEGAIIFERINLDTYEVEKELPLPSIFEDFSETNINFVDMEVLGDSVNLLFSAAEIDNPNAGSDVEKLYNIPLIYTFLIESNDWLTPNIGGEFENDLPLASYSNQYEFINGDLDYFTDSTMVAYEDSENSRLIVRVQSRVDTNDKVAFFIFTPYDTEEDINNWTDYKINHEGIFRLGSVSKIIDERIFTFDGSNSSFEIVSANDLFDLQNFEILPKAKMFHGSITVNEKVYSAGGYLEKNDNNLEIYYPEEDSYTYVNYAPNGERCSIYSAKQNLNLIGDNLYLSGCIRDTESKIDIISTIDNKLKTTVTLPEFRSNYCSVAVDEHIYIFGGRDLNNQAVETSLIFKPEADSCKSSLYNDASCWEEINNGNKFFPAEDSTVTSCASIGKLIYVSGKKTAESSEDTLSVFDTSTKTWADLSIELPDSFNPNINTQIINVIKYNMVALNEKISIFTQKGDMFEFNPNTNQWSNISASPKLYYDADFQHPLFSSFVYKGKIYKTGGFMGFLGISAISQAYQ